MAEALPSTKPAREEPPVDMSLVRLRYRHHRRRRNVRIGRRIESRLAHYRFYVVLGVLLAMGGVFAAGTLKEIHRLFGF
ncbi:MAG TPA: hypothetical protein VLW49_01690 [Gaiellaceae bacterium]|nr:hypothetical protein [Gaiellaceae bacterium]